MDKQSYKGNPIKLLASANDEFEVFLIKRYHLEYVVVSAASDKLLIFQIPFKELESFKGTPNFSLQSVPCKRKVIHAWESEKRLFAIDTSGDIFCLELSSAKSDEGDIFSSEDESDLQWVLSNRKKSSNCDSALAACPYTHGICVLANASNSTRVNVVLKNETVSVKVADNCSKAGSLLKVCDSALGLDFMKKWFPGKKLSIDGEHLFVGLDDGSVYVVALFPIIGPPLLLFKSIHSILSLSWYQDESSLKYDGLLILLNSGCLTKLHPFGEEIYFPFKNYIESSLMTEQFIISSNGFEIYVTRSESSYEKTVTIPSVGANGFVAVPGKNSLVVAGTVSKELILINLSNLQSVVEQVCPDFPKLEELETLISKANYLNKLTEKIKIHDSLLKAKSLFLRANILKRHCHITVHVIQVFDTLHTLRIKINFSIPGIVFSKDDWKLIVSVEVRDDKCTKEFNLSENLSSAQPLMKLLNMPFYFDLLYNIEISLMFSHSRDILIPIGKKEMDASYFIFPHSLKDLYEITPEVCFQFEGLAASLDVPFMEDCVPEHIFSKLLHNSKHMWRSTEWKQLLNSEGLLFILFGYPVEMKISKNVLRISSTNIKVCCALKIAVLLCLNKMDNIILRENLLLDIMAWYQAEEILRVGKLSKELFHEVATMIKDFSRYNL